ncbi:Protein CBG17809 [Caenorhabditis briggsae]|uniref:Protein CBG17809 n=1 Tax=Caenorhabditis briggsae TaxID=6238 RepID=B0K0A2_CAEBR|nr:Protein CBG17809 [Caenorhabditis briggsae]CAP35371.1 Protein CBG17809 [Caenorhabditis briggsae]
MEDSPTPPTGPGPSEMDEMFVKSEDTPTARPKRQPKKNVRYSNADYLMGVAEGAPSSSSGPPKPQKSELEVPKSAARKRKSNPRQEEQAMILTDASQIHVAMEYEIPQNHEDDDGPPVLDDVEYGDEDVGVGQGGEADDGQESDYDEMAPDLERNPLTKKRGRPRLPENMVRPPPAVRVKPSPRVTPRSIETTRIAQQNVRLFHPELDTTPEGDLKTEFCNFFFSKNTGWLLPKPPRLPPLTTEKGAFVFYVNGSSCKNAKEISNDDLRPWTAVSDANIPNSVNIKPNVRRHAVARLSGQLRIVRHETRLAEYHLTEYNARLPREQRLKKKFEPQPYEGMRGGLYLKLRPGCLAWAHNKKNLLDFMYNNTILVDKVALNVRLPDLPPLIETAGVFAFFAPSQDVANQIHHAPDGLSPWTVNATGMPDDDPSPAPRVRSTRRALILEQDGALSLAKDPKEQTDCILVETMSTLARCKRIRKRVSRKNSSKTEFSHKKLKFGIFVAKERPGLAHGAKIAHSELKLAVFELILQLKTLQIRILEFQNRWASVGQALKSSIFSEERGILNQTKPLHPPIVTNARAYAFFVAGTAIFPHDINRDDFSPWSGNGTAENLTRYRTKVRKIGASVEPNNSTFLLKDNADYKTCQFHLVYLYSTNPRDPRLRKKIYYLMETESKMVVSHALIIYDYTTEGRIPKLSSGQYKPVPKRQSMRNFNHSVQPDPTDEQFFSEDHRTSPFAELPNQCQDGTLYLHVTDRDFWTDRNRQIQFLVNEGNIIEEMGCLNNKVPDLPPPITGKGLVVFFVDMRELNIRALTIDKLVPWSESVSNSAGPTIRPKSCKTPLMVNAHGQLRVSKSPDHSTYQIHTYTATLPRCTRLRKKVVYVLKNGGPCGHALIMYSFTEAGETPQPLHKAIHGHYARGGGGSDDWYHNLDQNIREDVDLYMRTMNPGEAIKSLYEVHGIQVTRGMLYALRQSAADELDVETAYGSYATKDEQSGMIDVEMMDSEEMMVEEEEIIVEHTETVPYDHQGNGPRRNPFLEKNVPYFKPFFFQATAGFVRGSVRNDALWRIAQKQFGVETQDQTFDQIFKLLYQRDEQRLLHNINVMFNVDIVAGDETQILEEEEHPGAHYLEHSEHQMMVVEEEVEGGGAGGPQEYMQQVVVDEEEMI